MKRGEVVIVDFPFSDGTDLSPNKLADQRRPQTIEDWTRVNEGLSEQQIEEFDKIAKTRANLTRELP